MGIEVVHVLMGCGWLDQFEVITFGDESPCEANREALYVEAGPAVEVMVDVIQGPGLSVGGRLGAFVGGQLVGVVRVPLPW